MKLILLSAILFYASFCDARIFSGGIFKIADVKRHVELKCETDVSDDVSKLRWYTLNLNSGTITQQKIDLQTSSSIYKIEKLYSASGNGVQIGIGLKISNLRNFKDETYIYHCNLNDAPPVSQLNGQEQNFVYLIIIKSLMCTTPFSAGPDAGTETECLVNFNRPKVSYVLPGRGGVLYPTTNTNETPVITCQETKGRDILNAVHIKPRAPPASYGNDGMLESVSSTWRFKLTHPNPTSITCKASDSGVTWTWSPPA